MARPKLNCIEGVRMKPRIAMIDDEQDILESYVDLLSPKYEIATFNHPDYFINKVKEIPSYPFEMIVLDYNMGEKNGLDLIVELKKMNVHTPFILMSGYLDKDCTIKANNLGVSKILEKPVPYQILDEEVSAVLLETQLAQIQKKTRDLAFEVNAVLKACSNFFNSEADRHTANRFFDVLENHLKETEHDIIQNRYFEELQTEIFSHLKTEQLLIRQIRRKKISGL